MHFFDLSFANVSIVAARFIPRCGKWQRIEITSIANPYTMIDYRAPKIIEKTINIVHFQLIYRTLQANGIPFLTIKVTK